MIQENDTNQILTTFARMASNQRTILRKILKAAQPKLDYSYPKGMPEPEPKATDHLILPN
jgi:hypothetical protein